MLSAHREAGERVGGLGQGMTLKQPVQGIRKSSQCSVGSKALPRGLPRALQWAEQTPVVEMMDSSVSRSRSDCNYSVKMQYCIHCVCVCVCVR